MICDNCGCDLEEDRFETIEGFNLCSECDSMRSSCENNTDNEMTLEDFNKDIYRKIKKRINKEVLK